MTIAPLDPRTARSEVQIEVSVERVWKALTTPADLECWFPREATIEPGETGRYRFGWGPERCHVWEIGEWEPGRRIRLVDVAAPDRPRLVTDLHLRGGDERPTSGW